MTWLNRLPFLRSRRALAEATRKLLASTGELDSLRAEVQKQAERLAEATQLRRRLERRLVAAGASDVEHPLLVFEHIPKTAGTTFRRSYLIEALPSAERWILAGGERNQRDRDRFLSLSPAERAPIRIVAGHDAEALRPHLPAARFITLVRDPIDRAISSYLHARFHEGGETLWPDVREQGMSLEQFTRRYIPSSLQSRIVLGDDYEDLDADEIRHRLTDRYTLVGYTEAFDEFVYLLHEIEGLPLAAYGNRLVRAERESYVPSDTDLESVRRSHSVDALLHQIVKEDFNHELMHCRPVRASECSSFSRRSVLTVPSRRSDNVMTRGRVS
jgi:hypothetical protein